MKNDRWIDILIGALASFVLIGYIVPMVSGILSASSAMGSMRGSIMSAGGHIDGPENKKRYNF